VSTDVPKVVVVLREAAAPVPVATLVILLVPNVVVRLVS
jgi:hypothetical protein